MIACLPVGEINNLLKHKDPWSPKSRYGEPIYRLKKYFGTKFSVDPLWDDSLYTYSDELMDGGSRTVLRIMRRILKERGCKVIP